MSRSRRAVVQWPVLVWTAVVWVLVWGDLSVANVLAGVLLGLLVVLVFPQPPVRFPGSVRPGWVLRLVVVFAWDLVLASIQVARFVLSRRTPVSSVIEVRLRTASLAHLTATAELLSLVPGSIIVEVRPSTHSLFVHAIDVEDDEAVEQERRTVLKLEERVVRAFGTDAEIADVESGDPTGHGRHPRRLVHRGVHHHGPRAGRTDPTRAPAPAPGPSSSTGSSSSTSTEEVSP